MKSIILWCMVVGVVFAFPNLSNAQFIQSSQADSLSVQYSLKLYKKKKRNDVYILTAHLKNLSKNDLFYEVPLTKDELGKEIPSKTTREMRFAKIFIANSTELLPKKISFIGKPTKYKTKNGNILFKIKADSLYSIAVSFRMNPNTKPIIGSSIDKEIKPLHQFNIVITPEIIAGFYRSNCSIDRLQLIAAKDTIHHQTIIKQLSNNKFTLDWINNNNDGITYTSTSLPHAILRYYQKKEEIYLLNEDGKLCIWKRE